MTEQASTGNQLVTDKLFAAIARKKFKLASILIEGGVKINTKLSSGITPIMAVCDSIVDEDQRHKKKKLLLCLLDNGAKINAVDKSRRSALHYACICGDTSIIQLLKSRGAKSNIRDLNEQYPEFYLDCENLTSPRRRSFSLTRRDSIASMMNIPTAYRTWDSREFLDSILE